MEQFSDDRVVWRRAFVWSAYAGSGLGVTAIAGGTTLVREAGGGLAGFAVVATSLVASLLVGLWAGAPAAHRAPHAIQQRWVTAAISFTLAGGVATMWQIYTGVAITGFGLVLALLALVSAPAYALGLVFPLFAAEAGTDAPIGFGTAGYSVAGALAGLSITIPLAGLLLIPLFGAPPLFLAAAVLLLFPLLHREPEGAATVERVLRELHTPLSTLRVTEVSYPGERQPERRLYLDDEQESGELSRSGAPTLAYVAAAESWLARDAPRGGSYLFLGGGAYTLPRRVAERDPTASITVVEVDPAVTRLAYDYFGVRRDHGIRTVTGDARAFLEDAAGGEFDRIYLDVYAGSETVPYHLITREAFSLLRARLAPGGVVGMNLIGVTSAPEAVRFWSVVATAADVLPDVALYTHLGPDFPDLQNLMLLASPDASRDYPASIGTMERWSSAEWDRPNHAVVLRDLYPTSAGRVAAAPSASRPGSAG